jgi:signal transduction histidine kinase/DNA-binding response OmpR family regulator
MRKDSLRKGGGIAVFLLVLLVLLFGVFLCFPFRSYAAEGEYKRVLFISSYSYSWPSTPLQAEGIKEVLAGDVLLDYEFMNTKSVDDERSQQLFQAYMSDRLSRAAKYNVVIVGDDAAFQFAMANKDTLFKDIPIIFEGVNDVNGAVAMSSDDLVTGVVEKISYDTNIELAKKIKPDVKELVAVLDDTLTGAGERAQFYGQKENFPELKFSEINTSELTYDEICAALENVPADAMVFYLIMSDDKEHNVYSNREAVEVICAHTNVPVMRFMAAGIGDGVLGGNIISHKEMGRIAGRMAMDILNGKPSKDIPVVMNLPSTYYIDAKVAEKFKLPLELFPPNTNFINRELSFYKRYEHFIWIVLISCVLTVLITQSVMSAVYAKRSNSLLMTKNDDLKKAILFANKASKAKSDFLSRMSHEIRTPINAITGLAELTRHSCDDSKKVAANLNRIIYSSKILLNIVNDILDMSAIENEKMEIGHSEFDFKMLLTSCTAVYYPLCSQKGIEFELELHNIKEERLIGDQLRLNQILNNLLSNAIKFTEAGGSVRLIVSQETITNDLVYLRFIVRDTGCGMSDDMMGHLFSPFQQESAQTALKYGGSGLGLAITKNLTRLMNGVIDVKSEKNVGSEFTVVLPFEYVHAEEKAIEVGVKKLKALVIDVDEEKSLHVASMLERSTDCCDMVFEIQSLREHIEEANNGRPYDVCFINLDMPDRGAYGLIYVIESSHKKKMRVVALTYDVSENEAEAKQAGADMVLAKPIFQSTLYNALNDLFELTVLPRSSAEGKKEYHFENKRILLAEDNEINREIAIELLSMTGIAVETAENGQEAYDLFVKSDEKYYDAILMDIQMPLVDGYTAARMIRQSAHRNALNIPIVAMTANAFKEDIAAALNAGMNGHIAKPIDTETLYSMLEKILN